MSEYAARRMLLFLALYSPQRITQNLLNINGELLETLLDGAHVTLKASHAAICSILAPLP